MKVKKMPIQYKQMLGVVTFFFAILYFSSNIYGLLQSIPEKPHGLNWYDSLTWDFNSQITLPLFIAPLGVALLFGFSKICDFSYSLFTQSKSNANRRRQ